MSKIILQFYEGSNDRIVNLLLAETDYREYFNIRIENHFKHFDELGHGSSSFTVSNIS
jgi:hypothetical protein